MAELNGGPHRSPPPSPSMSDEENQAEGTSWKWLRLRRSRMMEVGDKVQRMLQAEPGHVNVVMVCGRLRAGKSYLMNSLMKDSTCFSVSPQAQSHTLGAEISPRLLPLESLEGEAGGPKVAFVDLEGQGVKGHAQDVKLATPFLLLAKVVILVDISPSGPAPQPLLEKLQMIMHAAEYINELKDRKKLFGSLHVVLRDCHHQEQECWDIIFKEENVNADEVESDEHRNEIELRNKLRKDIDLCFEEKPVVWCLPKLAQDTAPEDYRQAAQPFRLKVDEIRRAIVKNLRRPKELNRQPLTGRLIADLMEEMAKQLGTDKPALNPPSLMERVAEVEARRACDDVAREAEEELGALLLPMAPSTLAQELEGRSAKLAASLESRLSNIVAVPAVADAREKYQKRVDLLSDNLRQRNGFMCQQLERQVTENFRELLSKLLEAIPPERTEQRLQAQIEKVKGQLDRKIDGYRDLQSIPELGVQVRESIDRALREQSALLLEKARSRRMSETIQLHRRRRRLLVLAMCLIVAGIGSFPHWEEKFSSAGLMTLAWARRNVPWAVPPAPKAPQCGVPQESEDSRNCSQQAAVEARVVPVEEEAPAGHERAEPEDEEAEEEEEEEDSFLYSACQQVDPKTAAGAVSSLATLVIGFVAGRRCGR